MADLSPDDRDLVLALAGSLLGFSQARRFDFDDDERRLLRRAAGLLARLADRTDLVPEPGPGSSEAAPDG